MEPGNICYDTHMDFSKEKQEELVRRAMELAAQTAAAGNRPFAALLVDADGAVILEDVNTVTTGTNVAAHAEINLLFQAAQKLHIRDLSSYALVSNAASCPMCATALIKAGVTNFYYGAPNEATMVPSITMEEVIAKTPHPVNVHGNVLANECSGQIKQLSGLRQAL